MNLKYHHRHAKPFPMVSSEHVWLLIKPCFKIVFAKPIQTNPYPSIWKDKKDAFECKIPLCRVVSMLKLTLWDFNRYYRKHEKQTSLLKHQFYQTSVKKCLLTHFLLPCFIFFYFLLEQKRFVKGLRQYGKNFFRIRKDLLPHKETVCILCRNCILTVLQ